MKTSTKIAIAATAATAALLFVGGVIREIKQIKKLTTDVDDACPEEILYEKEVELPFQTSAPWLPASFPL